MEDDILSKHDADLLSLGVDVKSATTTNDNQMMDDGDDMFSSGQPSGYSDYASPDNGTQEIYGSQQLYESQKIEIEPESITKWKNQVKERIEKQEQEAEIKLKEIREKAQKDIEEFKKNRLTRITNTFQEIHTTNGMNKLSGSESNIWSKAVSSSNLNTRSPYCLKDVTRMRKVFASLKEQESISNIT